MATRAPSAPRVRKSPPHRFTLFGKTWRVRFVDPMKVKYAWKRREREFIRRHRLTIHGLTMSARSTGRRDIYIRPQDRLDWEVFAHELLHALEEEMAEHRRERGWRRRPLSHPNYHRLAIPLGEFLRSNLNASVAASRPPRTSRRPSRRRSPARRTGSS